MCVSLIFSHFQFHDKFIFTVLYIKLNSQDFILTNTNLSNCFYKSGSEIKLF